MNLTKQQQLEIFKELYNITYNIEDPEKAITKIQNYLALLIAKYNYGKPNQSKSNPLK